ncbi:MAG TPA: ATP-binding cassette domain-containing protein, partial [Flexilinea sp.]|nr:ATP-binding cassette domain-containing protein [Flexilinea sp.]
MIASIENLGMTFPSENGGLQALSDINLTLYDREFVCIIGPSGSGKSTLLRILADVLVPTQGKVTFADGQNPNRAIVFQSSNLLPWMNVIQNIALPLKIRGAGEKEALSQAGNWIRRVGLNGFEYEWPQNLSGGMKQRVAIAR